MEDFAKIQSIKINDSTLKKLEQESKKPIAKVAVYSTKNLFKYGVGELKVGYNIVPKEHEEFWLSLDAVRSATPEEVAKEYSK
jgi:hypothetical protein